MTGNRWVLILHRSQLRVVLLAVTAFFMLAGCSERKVMLQDDEDEIIAYLSLTEEGRELFRTEDLIPNTPYTPPFGDTVYRDIVDSVWRDVNVRIDSLPRQIGTPGEYFVAEVRVVDIFFVTTGKVASGDTTSFPAERHVTRYGYFAKVGDDSRPFLGWVLWAYNSLGAADPPITLTARTADGRETLASDLSFYSFSPGGADYSYIRLSDINTLLHGDTVAFLASRRSGQQGVYYNTVSFDTDSGFTMEPIDSIPGSFQHWADTIVTRSPNPRLWNVIFIQSFLEPPNAQFIRGWCIPYRVPQ